MADKFPGGVFGVILLMVGIVLLVLWFAGQGQPPAQSIPVQGGPPAQDTLDACSGKAVIENTTVRFDVKDRINLTTSPDVNATPELNGKQLSSLANINVGGSFRASPGGGYIVHLREDTSADTSATDYYYEVVRGTIPCDGTFTVQKTMGLEGGINVAVFNKNNTENTTAAGQSMTDGETIVLNVVIDGNTNDAFYGNPSIDNPLGFLIVFDVNDDTLELAEPAGVPFKSAGLPKNYSNIHGADSKTFAYELTGVRSLEEFKSYDLKFLIKAQASSSPFLGGNDDLNYTIYDPTAFPDSTTGGFTWGWVDTDGAGTNIGATNESGFVILN